MKKEQMEVIAVVMRSKAYNDIDKEQDGANDEISAGQTEIELDIQTLSINRIRFLRNALLNPGP